MKEQTKLKQYIMQTEGKHNERYTAHKQDSNRKTLKYHCFFLQTICLCYCIKIIVLYFFFLNKSFSYK